MTYFFDLPRELRDETYKYLLTTPWPEAPQVANCARGRIRREIPDGVLDDEIESDNLPEESPSTFYEYEENVRYPTPRPSTSVKSLLCVNRQIHNEVTYMASRVKMRYELQIGFRGDIQTLYPTWAALPARVSHIHELNLRVHLRPGRTPSICDMEDDDDDRNEGNWVILSGMALLARVLERGAGFFSRGTMLRDLTVGTLVIDTTDDRIRHSESDQISVQNNISLIDNWFSRFLPDDAHSELISHRVGRVVWRASDAVKEWELKRSIHAP